MWKRKAGIFSVIGLLILLISTGCGSGPSGGGGSEEPQSKAKVSLSPATNTISPGNTLMRTVKVENIENTFYVAFDLTYDPNIIEYVEASEGTFLNRNGTDATSFHAALQDGNQGRITLGLTRLGAAGDVSGDGTLLILTFRTLNKGTTSLAFANPKGFKNSANQDVVIDDWENGTVTVE